MSRAQGRTFAGFFPQAPAVVQERKRLARDRNGTSTKPFDLENGDSAGAADPHVSSDDSNNDPPGSRGRSSGREIDGTRDQDGKHSPIGDAGDLLNAVGSASSHNSAHSSVFSNGGALAMSLPSGAGAGSAELTPATTHESSPPEGRRTPMPDRTKLMNKHVNASGLEYSPISPRSTRAATPIFQDVKPASPERKAARPPSGTAKGKRVIYDPELDPKPSKEQRKRGVQYRDFGKEEYGPSPSDPRLAIPGYKSGQGNINIRPAAASGTWKFRPRPAPYTIVQYAWDPVLSVGPGPPTSVVVTGFNPFTSDAQLRAFFSSFGEIAEVDNKTDPSTGTFLGVCLIRYRDSRGRGESVAAAAAAKRAEKEGTGQRLGVQTVRVERDRNGKRCKRYAETIARKNQDLRQEEQRLEATLRPSVPRPVPIAPTSTADPTPAPPPNAPKGPKPVPRSVTMASLVETEPILTKIKRKPYIFISQANVPVMGTTIPHLKKRLKTHRWEEVRCDETGYYIVFEDHKRGEDEAVRCFREYNNRELFTYRMIMECQQYGNPNYERSPSPERAIAQKRQREEDERIQKENELDIEEEKKQRALDMDPVIAAMEQLRSELKDKIMADIKRRIGAPALHDFLDPSRHVDKRRKLGISDPTEQSRPPAFLTLAEDNELRRPATGKGRPLYASSIQRIQREELRPTANVFLDERRQTQRKPKRKVDVRPLHQRLEGFYGDDESDDEHRARLNEDQDSQTASRMGSVPPSERDDGSPLTPRKRRRIERSETPHEEESGDEDLSIAKTGLTAKSAKGDPEDMALADLQLIVKHLPPASKLYKQAKLELAARKKAKEDDHLFRDKADDEEGPLYIPIGGENEILETTEIHLDPKSQKPKPKTKRKTKKQLFEEREAAKASATLEIPEVVPAVEIGKPTDEDEEDEEEQEEEEEEERAEVEWGVSTVRPRRTVEDDFDQVLDVDGWQHLLKDDEDVQLLKEVLADRMAASLPDINLWAYQQKAIKQLNNGITTIHGYYVPNSSGCARTEGYKKILESEKSMYLPHRIKVAKSRERREAESTAERSNPAIAAESARLAKMAGNASSRSNRANNRTQAKDITHAKQSLLAEGQATDAIRFNQLKKRKKLVKFDRSAIHGWGLYAEQNIAASDMIIEYVGEKVRQAVANIRELRYDKQGMGSSYLFRIDDDTVVDATKKGGIARFINHSCAPNCTAKIVRVDDEMRIAIYAKTEIKKGDELTYDYKFERESDSDMRVPCLCGSEVCKGFLN